MKYRTKLLLTFVVIGMLANGIAAALLYQRSHDYLFEGCRAKLLSITATTATLLDGDPLKTIHARNDEDSSATRDRL